MTTLRLEGKEPAAHIKEWTADSVQKMRETHGFSPRMVTVQVGENLAAERYVRNQLITCEKAGIEARFDAFAADTPKEEFLKYLASVGADDSVDGIILQTPFPAGWRADEILRALPPDKDVEGVHPENLGRLYLGELDIPLPCTAWAVLSLLEWYGRGSFEGTNCVVVGRSPNVGRAAALLLMHRQGTVTICHTRTSSEQLRAALASAQVVVAAAGAPGLVRAEYLPASSWVVDVGTNVDAEGRLVGDVQPEARGLVEAISPVPGGVGPLTVSLLMANVLLCAARRRLGTGWRLPKLSQLRVGRP